MRELVILKVLKNGAQRDAKGCLMDVETQEGPRQLRFTFEDAERLIANLQAAGREPQPLPEKPKVPARWEATIDPVNQLALLRGCFADHTTSEAAFSRQQIAAVAEFLQQALKRFEAGTETRQ
jgi:hypothetical protein